MAYTFSGTDQAFHVPDTGAVAQGTVATVCAWIKPDVITGTYNVVARDEQTNSDRVFQFRVNNSNLEAICFVNDSTTATAASSGGLTAGAWHFVAFTFDGTTIHVYINSGASAGNASLSGNLSADQVGITIGGRSRYNATPASVTEDYDGAIAECAQWSRVLSAGELDLLADSFSPLFLRSGLQWNFQLVAHATDRIAGMAATAIGSPAVSEHPRMIYPSGLRIPVLAIGEELPAGFTPLQVVNYYKQMGVA